MQTEKRKKIKSGKYKPPQEHSCNVATWRITLSGFWLQQYLPSEHFCIKNQCSIYKVNDHLIFFQKPFQFRCVKPWVSPEERMRWTHCCIAYCSSSCSLHLKSAKATAGLHESIWEQDQSSFLCLSEEVLNVSDAMGKYWRVPRSSWKAWWFQQECEYSGDIRGLMVLKLQLTPMNLTWEKGIPCRRQDRRQDSEKVESEAEGKFHARYLLIKDSQILKGCFTLFSFLSFHRTWLNRNSSISSLSL